MSQNAKRDGTLSLAVYADLRWQVPLNPTRTSSRHGEVAQGEARIRSEARRLVVIQVRPTAAPRPGPPAVLGVPLSPRHL